MISLLQSILCVLMQIPYFVVWAAITAFNSVIIALGALLVGLAAILPDFPTLPVLPEEVDAIFGWVNWVFPVNTVVDIFLWMATVWLVWQGVAIALRWAKYL